MQEAASLTATELPKSNLPLAKPEGTKNAALVWPYMVAFIVIHIAALLAFFPYFFSWTGVALVFIGNYFFGSMGINVGYHRLLTHRSFQCPLWLERVFVLLGVCALQDSPGRWVAIHRMHHQHSDKQPDPHSPLVNFIWGHFGWLLVENRDMATLSNFYHYANDVFRDPFYMWLHRRHMWFYLYLLQALLCTALGFLVGWLWADTTEGMVQIGLSLFVWGVLVRTVYIWHITWAVNSASHLWGYRNYETGEASRNNWVVALLTNGEGWHNNHHAAPRAAAHGHRWWEIDLTYSTLRLLQLVGLVWNVVPPKVPAHRQHHSD